MLLNSGAATGGSSQQHVGEDSGCAFCLTQKTKVLEELHTSMRAGTANFSAAFRPTGTPGKGNQEGIKLGFGVNGSPALMVVLTTLAGMHTQRLVQEYWEREGKSDAERMHILKAMVELACHLEDEYTKRMKLIDGLENGFWKHLKKKKGE
jgi:hypothetical protein